MYLTCIRKRSSSGVDHQHWLLRRSYREQGKVKNETIASLKGCSPAEIQAIQQALDNKKSVQTSFEGEFQSTQGKSIGSVYVLHQIALRLGIIDALGNSFHAKLSLWLIIARILEQGSRLSATRLDSLYDIASVVKLERGFDENNLYDTLHWLCNNQIDIEDKLYHRKQHTGQFYWYDVTSTYLEGEYNSLGAYGYNRDQKKRKKQIVVGLLCVNNGDPVSIEAFKGNTQDTQTFESQLIKLCTRFGCENVIVVCDRGLIREKQKILLKKHHLQYITALPMPQIKALLNSGILNLVDFSNGLKSVLHEGVRYIYRCNPERAKETQYQRSERLSTAQRHVDRENEFLKTHTRASSQVAKNRIKKYLKKLCIVEWVSVHISKKQLVLRINEESLKAKSAFDGCYVWTTEISETIASDQEIYDRYKDLKYVEEDFRTLKTCFLEIRPVYVRTLESTHGHIFHMMLAHMIVRELRQAWAHLNITVEEGLMRLSSICYQTLQLSDGVNVSCIPKQIGETAALLEALKIELPKSIQNCNINVVTRKKTRSSVK